MIVLWLWISRMMLELDRKWSRLGSSISSVGLDRPCSAAMVWIVAKYALEPFMADAVVARPWMRYQGHIAHSTMVHVSYTPWFGLYAIYTTECCTSVCNLYLLYIKLLKVLALPPPPSECYNWIILCFLDEVLICSIGVDTLNMSMPTACSPYEKKNKSCSIHNKLNMCA